jgi:myosin heavy subunit
VNGSVDARNVAYRFRIFFFFAAGLLETVKIRKAGFPVRIGFQAFVDRYGVVSPAKAKDAKSHSAQILKLAEAAMYRIGATKVFMKEGVEAILEKKREDVFKKYVVRIQAFMRMVVARKKYRQRLAAIRRIQRGRHWAVGLIFFLRLLCISAFLIPSRFLSLGDARRSVSHLQKQAKNHQGTTRRAQDPSQ